MDRTTDVLEALESRARMTSLEELGRAGRSRVKVIRPSEIAGMIKDAVENALVGSGYVPPEKVDELVEQGRAEFDQLVAERQAERTEQARLADEAERLKADLVAREEELTGLRADLTARDEELERLCGDLATREEELAGATAELEALRAAPEPEPAEEPEGLAGGVNAELMMRLMGEIAELKAQAATAGSASAPAADDGGLAAKLEQIVGTLDNKIDKLGMKVGITQAVEGEQVKLDGIFADHGETDMESNLDTVKVKARKGAGIGANLERMKKLRQQGGGD